jgi:hypothetical protein
LLPLSGLLGDGARKSKLIERIEEFEHARFRFEARLGDDPKMSNPALAILPFSTSEMASTSLTVKIDNHTLVYREALLHNSRDTESRRTTGGEPGWLG